MTIKVDLYNDFVELVRNRLKLDQSLEPLDVVKRYAWYDSRHLPQKRWRVYYSNELQQNPFFIKNREYIDAIRAKAEAGKDITSHASTSTEDINGKDDLLADWGIYHLHLGHGEKTARSNKFVNRAKELLFIFPKENNLYFLNILNHGSWTDRSLIKILHDNWSSTIERYKVGGVNGLNREVTEKELYKLRKNAINTLIEIGDDVYLGAGLGFTTDGMPFQTLRMAENLEELLNNHSNALKENEKNLRAKIEKILNKSIEFTILNLKLVEYEPKNAIGKIQIINFESILYLKIKKSVIEFVIL